MSNNKPTRLTSAQQDQAIVRLAHACDLLKARLDKQDETLIAQGKAIRALERHANKQAEDEFAADCAQRKAEHQAEHDDVIAELEAAVAKP